MNDEPQGALVALLRVGRGARQPAVRAATKAQMRHQQEDRPGRFLLDPPPLGEFPT
jgi:hypothetical protein